MMLLVLAVVSAQPGPTPPPTIVHTIAAHANPQRACGAYHYSRTFTVESTRYVVCVRPTPPQKGR